MTSGKITRTLVSHVCTCVAAQQAECKAPKTGWKWGIDKQAGKDKHFDWVKHVSMIQMFLMSTQQSPVAMC